MPYIIYNNKNLLYIFIIIYYLQFRILVLKNKNI